MFNGRGEQQVTILLPNPHPGGDQSFVAEPDWRRLYLWDSLTRKFLGRGQDPMDQLAPKFFMVSGLYAALALVPVVVLVCWLISGRLRFWRPTFGGPPGTHGPGPRLKFQSCCPLAQRVAPLSRGRTGPPLD